MIKSWRNKKLQKMWEKNSSKGINSQHVKKLNMILHILDNATQLKDANFPGSNLHPLKGELEGFYAVSVSGNWRVIFKVTDDGNVESVDYLDYHGK